MKNYAFNVTKDAHGTVHTFRGPGLHTHIHFMQAMNEWATKCYSEQPNYTDNEAHAVIHMLESAYEAGKAERSKELLDLLGGKSRRGL